MLAVRRFLVVIALMFWLGGFTFYVGVVVPIGTEVLGSALKQGRITREVTWWLNLAAVLALLILAWDALTADNPSPRARRALIGLWLLMVLCQGALFGLHAQLEQLLAAAHFDLTSDEVIRAAFGRAHRFYLWAHTLQWFAGVIFIGVMLWSWRKEDVAGGR
jgi:hypothetical protein